MFTAPDDQLVKDAKEKNKKARHFSRLSGDKGVFYLFLLLLIVYSVWLFVIKGH